VFTVNKFIREFNQSMTIKNMFIIFVYFMSIIDFYKTIPMLYELFI